MRVIAVCNQKGGVGKTTTAYHLASAAVRHGISTLLIDLDPQSNLTMIAAAEPVAADAVSIADVLSPRAGEDLADVVVPGLWQGLDVVPAIEPTLAGVRDELVSIRVGRESRLRQALQRHTGHDLVLIDCPPELGLLTINALTAANTAVVITESKLFAVQGTAGVLETIETIRAHYNPDLRMAGVIVNKHEGHTLTGQARLEELRAAGIPVLEPLIPKRTAIGDAAEAAVALEQWRGGDGPALAQLYADLLTHLMKERT